MGSSERFALVATCWTAALASAVAGYAIYRSGLLEEELRRHDFLPQQVGPATLTGHRQPEINRLAFVHTPFESEAIETGSLPSERQAEIALRGTDPDKPAGPSAPQWSAEIRPEAQPSPEPSLKSQPPALSGGQPVARFPWQFLTPSKPRFYTLAQRLNEIAPAANKRLLEKFEAAKAPWPPAELTLIAIKDEKALELHARQAGGAWKLVHRYKVLAASGGPGPKLRQGDRQVPEGVYSIALLNPNSAYHVSLRVNYPNAFDKQMAAAEGRKELGGDIMIHGKNLSAGCLAVGDDAAEELFTIAAYVGLAHVKLIIAPTDFRKNGVPPVEASQVPAQPAWVPRLYTEVATAMADFKPPKSTGLLSFWGN